MSQYTEYGGDPFRSLIRNDKVGHNSYWRKITGNYSAGLQDSAVAALRKLGFTGSLGDMLRAFYKDLSGYDDLTTAWANTLHMPDRVGLKNFLGKVKLDGDNTRIAKYGQSATLMLPSSFVNEVNSGYVGLGVANDGQWATWSTPTPAGVKSQFCFTMDLTEFGTVADNRKYIKSLDIWVRARDVEAYIFNNTTNAWVKLGDLPYTEDGRYGFVNGKYEVTSKVYDYISSANKVIVGVLSTTISNGTTISTKADVGYYEVKATFLK